MGQLLGRLLGRIRQRPWLLGRILRVGLSRPRVSRRVLPDPYGLRLRGWGSHDPIPAFPAFACRWLQGKSQGCEHPDRNTQTDHGSAFGRARSHRHQSGRVDARCGASQTFCRTDAARFDRASGDECRPDTVRDWTSKWANRESLSSSEHRSNGNSPVRDARSVGAAVGHAGTWDHATQRGAAPAGRRSASAPLGPCPGALWGQRASCQWTYADDALDACEVDGGAQHSVTWRDQPRFDGSPDDDAIHAEFGGPRHNASGPADASGRTLERRGALDTFAGSADSGCAVTDTSDAIRTEPGASDPLYALTGSADTGGAVQSTADAF